jgi:NADPH:quinone reductase-like Zn-dependent oxidoreductase
MQTATPPQPIRPDAPSPPTMWSIVQRRYGTHPDEVLDFTEILRPKIIDSQVLVRVSAASVDMGTWHCMTGMPYAMRLMGFGVRSPKAMNPGRAIAGVVESVARDVTAFKVGDEVYGSCDAAFAQYAAVNVAELALKPTSLSFEQAASAPISGGTALQAVRKGNVQPGQKVLIIGASGGVGTFAVQVAKAYGAEVTGVCSTSKIDLVRSLGANHVIDYTRDDLAKLEQRFDLIIDTGGNRPLGKLRRLLTHHGVLVVVGGETGGRWFGGFVGRSLRAMLLSAMFPQTLSMLASVESTEVLDALRDLIESRSVTPVIDRAYPLRQTAAAIQQMKDGNAHGKLVITTEWQ